MNACNLKRWTNDDERRETCDGDSWRVRGGYARDTHWRQRHLSESGDDLRLADIEDDTLNVVTRCEGKTGETATGTMRVAVRCVRSPAKDTLRNGPALRDHKDVRDSAYRQSSVLGQRLIALNCDQKGNLK